ncbi:serine/threonine protein kinase [Candidatus Sumerlaeota bacterium]|nr:serine/threonine protein kinase [Candidatus Sumerlaeota bacterium]
MNAPEPPDLPPPPPAIDAPPHGGEPGGSSASGQPASKLRPSSSSAIPVAGKTVSDPDQWTGKYLGPYLIRNRLSRGGMGEVLLGYDEALRRQVAVKVMDRRLVTDGDAIKRFEREARASASIQHSSIAGVYLVGLTDDGLPFLAMEFIDGGSLMDVIRKRVPLGYAEMARVMEEVAAGLQAARKQNIVHRDIKPANIMLTAKKEAKLVDFGLAKIFFEDSYVTQEGMVLGTPSYMAPEQGRGRVVDHRADIYSFGATFYHMIAGRPPFTADSPVQIMMKHVTAPLVPLKTLNQNVPVEFDEIIGKCMRKDVDERYQDYEPLLVDIKRLRLQCTARERGSVLGGDGNPATGIGNSGSLSLPPPPGIADTRGAASADGRRQAANATGAVIIQQFDESEQHKFWNPLTITAVAILALLVFGGAVAVILSSGKPPAEKKTGTNSAPAFAALLDRAAERTSNAQEAADTARAYRRYRDTVDILHSLQEGVVNYELDKQSYPNTLSTIANENSVRMNFNVDEGNNPLDGWGTPIAYRVNEKQIRSAGLDGTLDNSDDLVIGFDGTTEIPSEYEKLKGKS